jgi:diacylglycerol kinase family enzyme
MAATASLPQPRTLAPAPTPLRRPRLRPVSSPTVILLANGNASGIVRRPELVEGAGRLLRTAGARVETQVTSSLEELGAVVSEAGRRVVLLGGDGSVHAVANLPGTKPELAILPAGGANNIARSLGVPLELDAAARLAVNGPARRLDAISARTATRRMLVVEGVSVGFHALARAGYTGRNSTDVRSAVRAGVGALARFQPLTVGLEADGEFQVLRIGQLFAANLPFYGPSLHVAPGADPSDGLLDLVAIDVAGRRSLLPLVSRLRRGDHLGRAGVTRIAASRVRIATGGRSPIVADTTNLGAGTVELTVVPAALEVVGGAR